MIEAAAMLAESASPRMMPRCGAGHCGIRRASTRTKSGAQLRPLTARCIAKQAGVINVYLINLFDPRQSRTPSRRRPA